MKQTAICCIATVAPKRTPICCSFRTPLRVAQFVRGRDLGKREAQRRCTQGISRKLQQIAVCLQGDVHATANRCLFARRLLRGCETRFMRRQIDVCLSGNTAQQAFCCKCTPKSWFQRRGTAPHPQFQQSQPDWRRQGAPGVPIRHHSASLCLTINIAHETAGLPHPLR